MTDQPAWWDKALADLNWRMKFTDSKTFMEQPEVVEAVRRQHEQARKDAEQQDETRRKFAERQAAYQSQKAEERKQKFSESKKRWGWVAERIHDQPLTDIVDLHKPAEITTEEWYGNPTCPGCELEVSGYEYDMDDWPCQTFIILENWVKYRGW